MILPLKTNTFCVLLDVVLITTALGQITFLAIHFIMIFVSPPKGVKPLKLWTSFINTIYGRKLCVRPFSHKAGI